jgi:hypothetical protein
MLAAHFARFCSAELGAHGSRQLELGSRDFARDALDLAGIEHAGAEMARGLGATGHTEPQAFLVGTLGVAGCQVTGQEHITCADCRDRFEWLDAYVVEAALVGSADNRVAAVCMGDDRLACSQLAELV